MKYFLWQVWHKLLGHRIDYREAIHLGLDGGSKEWKAFCSCGASVPIPEDAL